MAIKTFSTGEVLTAANTNTYLANSGWVYVTSTTFSAVSTVSLNNCFSSTYDHYKVIINNYGSTTSFTRWRLRASGSDSSASSYFRYGFNTVYNAGSLVVYNGGPETSWVPCTSYGPAAAGSGTTELFISNPFLSTSNTMTTTDANDSDAAQSYKLNGMYNQTTSFDGFTIFPNGGTITGNITVYGIRKA
jgi:hypothetical protein